MAKASARQSGPSAEQAREPFQSALSTRAGTDCVGHAVRPLADNDDRLTVLSAHGVGAYDFMPRQAMLAKLLQAPTVRDILPFVRLSYDPASEYIWENDDGDLSRIIQGESGRSWATR